MGAFDHLKDLEVRSGSTAQFVLHALKGAPSLTVAPATEANKPYFNEVLRRARASARPLRSGNISVDLLESMREDDRRLYAKHVVKGWKGIVDSKGKPVPFSREACEEFLSALPDWLFDELREFCGAVSNFLPEGAADPEETAKN